MPSDPTPLFEPTNALLAAVKPVYLVALGVATVVWGVYSFVGRVDRIEADVQDIKYILCSTAPATTDTACRGVR